VLFSVFFLEKIFSPPHATGLEEHLTRVLQSNFARCKDSLQSFLRKTGKTLTWWRCKFISCRNNTSAYWLV